MQNQAFSGLVCGLVVLSLLALACEPDLETDDAGVLTPAPTGSTAGAGNTGGPGGIQPGITGGFIGGGASDAGFAGPGGGVRTDAGSFPGGAGGFNAGVGAGDAGPAGAVGGTAGAGGAPVKSAGCGSAMGPKSGTYMIDVAGMSRTYVLRVPDNYDANHPYRLILSYHPLGGTAESVSRGNFYGLWSMSNGSTIFAAPQGIDNGWRDSGRTRTAGGADINFTKALVEELTSKLCIDRSRMFAEGFSMGGSMSYAVACALPDLVRGVVAHSGGPMSGCVTPHTKPVAYFMTHGTQDTICRYPSYGVPEVNDFAKVNGCMAQAMPMPTQSAHACIDFQGCMPGYPARACIFVGGHTPSPSGNWVPGESWKFISQF